MKTRLLILVLLLISVCPAQAFFKPGDAAPDFEATTLNGQGIQFSDLKGKTLLVEMGATWCPACNQQAHQIDALRDYLRQSRVTYVAVYLADSVDSVQSHLQDENLAPADQILIDSGEARTNYSVFTIPRVLLIDRNFKIVFDDMVISKEELQQRIEHHLAAAERP